MKFSGDFGVFPDYLTKAKLHKFFHTLSGFYLEQHADDKIQPVENVIDEHLFIECLVLCSQEVLYKEPEPSNLEKVSDLKSFNRLDHISGWKNES